MTTSITNTQTCRVLVGAPGSGKTMRMLEEMATQRGCYVLAAPRQDLLEEHVARLQGFAARSRTTPTLQTIHSRQGSREPVGRRVTEALAAHYADAHVVVAITHEALLSLDGALLANWHVRIDEIPDATARSGQVRIGATWPALAAYYALEPAGEPRCSIKRHGNTRPKTAEFLHFYGKLRPKSASLGLFSALFPLSFGQALRGRSRSHGSHCTMRSGKTSQDGASVACRASASRSQLCSP